MASQVTRGTVRLPALLWKDPLGNTPSRWADFLLTPAWYSGFRSSQIPLLQPLLTHQNVLSAPIYSLQEAWGSSGPDWLTAQGDPSRCPWAPEAMGVQPRREPVP